MKLYILVLISFGVLDTLSNAAIAAKGVSENMPLLKTRYPSLIMYSSHVDKVAISQLLQDQILRIEIAEDQATRAKSKTEQMLEGIMRNPGKYLCHVNKILDDLIDIQKGRAGSRLCLNSTFDTLYPSLRQIRYLRSEFKESMTSALDTLLGCPDSYLQKTCINQYEMKTQIQLNSVTKNLNKVGETLDEDFKYLENYFPSCIKETNFEKKHLQPKENLVVCKRS
ncbi:unnamed protein product [Hermetia illucens]|uniref:Venom protein n=1 Tax=Hermetia illucens TaxID=343691 RepID=A0A7R8V702_HERIL|nr:unnamed protein product [Hermetia illucens]